MRVTVNGISVFYEVSGNGPALILIHGNSEDHTTFDDAVPYLEDRFTVYRPDTRGHGQSSPPPDGEYHYADMAADLQGFITSLGIERPVVCGYSDGGIVALLHAMDYPNAVSRVIACGANTDPSNLTGFWAFRLRLTRGHGDPKLRMMLHEPRISAEDLSRISCPVLSVAGSRDCIKQSDTVFIAESVRDGRVLIIPDADHSSYVEDGPTLARIILDGNRGP